jgi:drug/metabolite transporter (DMT)-like permease
VLTGFGVAGMWIIGGAIYPVMSNVTKSVAPMNLVFYRAFGSALFFLALIVLLYRSQFRALKLDRRLFPLFLTSLLFNPICAGALAWSSTKVPGAISALLFGTLPAMATLFGAVVGRRPQRLAILGVAISTIAVVFLVGAPSGNVTIPGIFGALFATLAWFAATEVWITFNPGYPLLLATMLQTAIGAAGCYLARPLLHSPPLHMAELKIGGVIFLIVAFATQHFAYLGISARVSGAVLTSFGFVNPVVAMVIGYLFYSQKITGVQGVAGLILLIGVALVVRQE